jgi:adenylate kinase
MLTRKKHLGPNSSIGITGSPGTGKKTVGLVLARMTGLEFLSINDFAIAHSYGHWQRSEFIVDLRKTRDSINTRGKIVCGHLLPYLIPKSKLDFVAVLRCAPRELAKRYLSRKYSKQKTKENLESELIGVIAAETVLVYGLEKTAEFDTSRTKPKSVAKKILETVRGERKRCFGEIDWMASLASFRAFLESLHD